MADIFEKNAIAMNSPAANAFAITPDNSTDFDQVTRAIYVGGDGDIAAVLIDDSVVTFSGAVAGTIIPVRMKRVNSTNTDATNLVGLY